jgi:hypothetical protein
MTHGSSRRASYAPSRRTACSTVLTPAGSPRLVQGPSPDSPKCPNSSCRRLGTRRPRTRPRTGQPTSSDTRRPGATRRWSQSPSSRHRTPRRRGRGTPTGLHPCTPLGIERSRPLPTTRRRRRRSHIRRLRIRLQPASEHTLLAHRPPRIRNLERRKPLRVSSPSRPHCPVSPAAEEPAPSGSSGAARVSRNPTSASRSLERAVHTRTADARYAGTMLGLMRKKLSGSYCFLMFRSRSVFGP